MKRKRDFGVVFANAGPYKRPRQAAYKAVVGQIARRNQFPNRIRLQKRYVPRTPGGQITAENHYFDTERTITTIPFSASTWSGAALDPNTTAMLCLFAPVIGDDIFNRMGRKIFVKKIRINATVKMPPETAQTAGNDGINIRIILFQDMQTNATQATGDLVIASGAANDAINMFQSAINFGRFKVWKDKKIVMKPPDYSGLTTAFVSQGISRMFKLNIKPNCWVNYNATNGGTVADVVDNSFHIIALRDSNSVLSTLEYKVRTVFLP